MINEDEDQVELVSNVLEDKVRDLSESFNEFTSKKVSLLAGHSEVQRPWKESVIKRQVQQQHFAAGGGRRRALELVSRQSQQQQPHVELRWYT